MLSNSSDRTEIARTHQHAHQIVACQRNLLRHASNPITTRSDASSSLLLLTKIKMTTHRNGITVIYRTPLEAAASWTCHYLEAARFNRQQQGVGVLTNARRMSEDPPLSGIMFRSDLTRRTPHGVSGA
jgi:hypothetical protein